MSPIKGISEIARLPRLGKIRLGTKKEGPDGTVYPVPSDHFICPDEVKKVFGEKPKKLRIMFPTEDKEQWASQYLRRYSASLKPLCRGDGANAISWAGSGTDRLWNGKPSLSESKEIVCNPRTCPYYLSGDCRRVMNLQFLLPDCPGFGVYQLDTSCRQSMLNVNSIVDFTRSICGRIAMIPMSLHLVKMEVEPEEWLGPAYYLNITCPYSLSEVQKLAEGPAAKALLLPPPDSEAPDDLIPPVPARVEKTPVVSTTPNETLLDLWARVKHKIWNFEIQDSQISNWFDKNYRLEVRLLDFEPPRPPEKFTAEMLSAFCQSIDRYVGR